VIVVSGLTGLLANVHLTKTKYRTLVTERERSGGQIIKVEWIENSLGFPRYVTRPHFGLMIPVRKIHFDTKFELGEVTGIEY
jgi:thioredoxin reductase